MPGKSSNEWNRNPGGPVRTGATEIGGDFPLRLAVYDAQSFELFWGRVPGAASYRLERDGQVVQEGGGTSRYVSGIDSSARFSYTLFALDRSGTVLASIGFDVSPGGNDQGDQLVPGSPGASTQPDGPIRTGQTSLAGNIGVRLAVYDAQSFELFWDRVPGAVRYQLSLSGGTVQESTAISYFLAGADPALRYDYGLLALDRSGAVLRQADFTVALRGMPQLTTFVPSPVPVKPPEGPGTTTTTP